MLPPIPTPDEVRSSGLRIAVAIPMERQVPAEAFLSLWNIARHGYKVIPHPYGRTDVQRNTIGLAVKKIPEAEITHVCMLDLDHMHPPDTVERLARWVIQDPERWVVAGLNFRRGAPYDPCIFIQSPDGQFRPPLEWDEGLIEVDALGHGAILISRKVFETIPGAWWQYSYIHFEKEIYPSEDIYFSALMQHHGVKLYCDTTCTSPHLISATVDEAAFRRYIADHPEKVVDFSGQEPANGPEPIESNTAPQFLKKGQ